MHEFKKRIHHDSFGHSLLLFCKNCVGYNMHTWRFVPCETAWVIWGRVSVRSRWGVGRVSIRFWSNVGRVSVGCRSEFGRVTAADAAEFSECTID